MAAFPRGSILRVTDISYGIPKGYLVKYVYDMGGGESEVMPLSHNLIVMYGQASSLIIETKALELIIP